MKIKLPNTIKINIKGSSNNVITNCLRLNLTINNPYKQEDINFANGYS